MATKYRVYNELSEEEKAQITTEKQWRKRGYCPVENEGELMYCNRSWSETVYFRADQVRRMSEMEPHIDPPQTKKENRKHCRF